jgi:phage gpG-like protein
MARPSSASVMSSLSGLRSFDKVTGGMLGVTIDFEPTVLITTKRIDKLGMDIRSFREPLKRAIQQVIAPSILKNFDSGGRPAWEPLSQGTLDIRKNLGLSGSSSPLMRTGLLRRTMGQFNIWTVGLNTAMIRDLPSKIWYGNIHQGGADKGSMASRIKKTGSAKKALESIMDDQVHAMRTGTTIKSSFGGIPARPFVMLQDEDIDGIDKVFLDWFEERIARAFPDGRF